MSFIPLLFIPLLIVAIIVVTIIIIIPKQKKEEKPNYQINTNTSPLEEEVKKEVMEETLNLDELFKTISFKTIKNDSDFDFGLKRTEKNLNKN
ncbi:MAG: hypothetical protein PUA73_02475 [Bacilli bacterium]|nr:hypothetical protein [Bacilli bacterium]